MGARSDGSLLHWRGDRADLAWAGVHYFGDTDVIDEAGEGVPPFQVARVRRYEMLPGGLSLYAISAPSSTPMRPATTPDTLRFVSERLGLSEGARVLLVTSQIYVPYQEVAAMRAPAFPRGIVPETVAPPIASSSTHSRALSQPSTYLQKIRSTFRECLKLVAPRPAGDAR